LSALRDPVTDIDAIRSYLNNCLSGHDLSPETLYTLMAYIHNNNIHELNIIESICDSIELDEKWDSFDKHMTPILGILMPITLNELNAKQKRDFRKYQRAVCKTMNIKIRENKLIIETYSNKKKDEDQFQFQNKLIDLFKYASVKAIQNPQIIVLLFQSLKSLLMVKKVDIDDVKYIEKIS